MIRKLNKCIKRCVILFVSRCETNERMIVGYQKLWIYYFV